MAKKKETAEVQEEQEAAPAPQLYRARKAIYYKNPDSTHFRKVLDKDSVVPLPHLTAAEIKLLVAMRIVEETEATEPKYLLLK